jgi:hypothetical protein
MSSIFFPLRTSVELFRDPSSPEAVTRAKEAAVLFDEVGFETGLYTVAIADTGYFDWWTPPRDITPDLLEHTREPIEPGAAMQIIAQAGQGPPRALMAGRQSPTSNGWRDETQGPGARPRRSQPR